MSTADEKLLEQFEQKHPDYQEWSEEWKMYRDAVGDVLVDKEKLLPRNAREPDDQYEFRVEVSEYIPESHLALSSLTGALYDEKPKREFPGQEGNVREFLDNADRRGNSWNVAIEQVCTMLLGYGTTRVLVNVPAIEAATGPVTRADEKSLGIRPYVVNYSPLSIIDWDVDDLGELTYIRIREERFKKRGDDLKKPAVKHIRMIEYNREKASWHVFAQGSKSALELLPGTLGKGESVHGLGMVPMVVGELKELRPMVGDSFVRYSSRADKQKFQSESDLAYDTYLHAHPFLKMWSDAGFSEKFLNSSTWLHLDPGGGDRPREDAEYIEVPDSAFDALQKVIEAKRVQIYRQANTDPLGILNSNQGMFQASGAARAWSFDTSEARILRKIADKMTQIELQVMEIVMRLQEPADREFDSSQRISKAEILYPEEFDLSATDTLIDQTERIAQMINSPALIRLLHKRIASSKVGDSSAETIRKIFKEIDDNELVGTPVGQENVFKMPPMSGVEGEDGLEEDGKVEGEVEGEVGGKGQQTTEPKELKTPEKVQNVPSRRAKRRRQTVAGQS